MNPISGGHSLEDELYNNVCSVKGPHLPGFCTEGGGLAYPTPQQEMPPPAIYINYDLITLKAEKLAVVLHTSDGNLGAVS